MPGVRWRVGPIVCLRFVCLRFLWEGSSASKGCDDVSGRRCRVSGARWRTRGASDPEFSAAWGAVACLRRYRVSGLRWRA